MGKLMNAYMAAPGGRFLSGTDLCAGFWKTSKNKEEIEYNGDGNCYYTP